MPPNSTQERTDLSATSPASSIIHPSITNSSNQCYYCEKSFSKLEHLRRHERSHVGSKPYSCAICNKSFGRQDSLARHTKLHFRENVRQSQSLATSELDTRLGLVTTEADRTENQRDVNSGLLNLSEAASASRALQGLSDSSTTGFMLTPPESSSSNFIPQEPSQWSESEELLQLLMSDTAAWPVTLPIMQFSPQNPDVAEQGRPFQSMSTHVNGPTPTGRGHQAVQQMTLLIADMSRNISRDIESTGITADFLDTCFSMFWNRFIPSFPTMHRSAFVSKDCPPPLILNMVAIGSLFVGTREAGSKGEALWRLAHTAVATSWQSMMHYSGPEDVCKGVQLVMTALLGQIYATLSQNRMIRTTSQIFHGLGFYWARQCNMYHLKPMLDSDIPSLQDSVEEKNKKWKSWLATEIQKRAVLGHYILDGLIAQASGNATSVRHVTNRIPLPVDDRIFETKSADDWIASIQAQRPSTVVFRKVYISLFDGTSTNTTQPLSRFSVWVVLEGLQSLVSENNEACGLSIGTPSQLDIGRALSQLYEGHIKPVGYTPDDVRDIMLRWHSICIQTAVNTKSLGLQICYDFAVDQDLYSDGPNMAPGMDIRTWINTSEARRALLHAISIYEIAEQMPFGRTHAIHIPSAIFTASTIYAAFHVYQSLKSLPSWPIDWSEVLRLRYEVSPLGGQIPDTYTQAFLAGHGVFGPPLSTSRNLLDDLGLLQVFLKSIASVSLIARPMGILVSRWIAIMPPG